MVLSHPQLLIAPLISLACVWYPAPWHIRNRNVATLSMIFGITAVDIVHITNSRSRGEIAGDLST
jgi:pheromone a factor receptor